jgi:hypothetical protein
MLETKTDTHTRQEAESYLFVFFCLDVSIECRQILDRMVTYILQIYYTLKFLDT